MVAVVADSPRTTERESCAEPVSKNSTASQAKRRRRRQSAIPKQIRKEIVAFAGTITHKYEAFFKSNRALKQRVVRLMATLLPPRPRRPGHPRNEETTRAVLMYNRLRRKRPEKKPAELWGMVAAALHPEYANLSAITQQDICHGLRERVRSRMRKRPRNSSRRKRS